MFFLHKINRRMLPMKLQYFLYLGGISSIVVFSSTIGKQMGYSPMIMGSMLTYLSIVTSFVKPITGIIVDKFPVKRLMFLTFILLSGILPIFISFIKNLPTETSAILSCDTTSTILKICSDNDSRLSNCDDSVLKLYKNNTEPVTCQLLCQQNESFRDEMCKYWEINDYCNTSLNNDIDHLNVSLFMNITDQLENNIIFRVQSVKMMGKQEILLPVCRTPVSTRCEMSCSNYVIMELATVPKLKRSIFALYEFWEYLIIMTVLWISFSVIWSLQDPICFDLLGDEINNFGKQRCWGSISWGIFSIFGGTLIDYFSHNDFQKNYTPIYYLCLIILLFDFALARNMKITETRRSENMFSDIYHLIFNLHVIIYIMWVIVFGMCTSMAWNYLFWYMEEIADADKKAWTKSLQGIAVGIQCGGEIPFMFFSGWIIKRIGHWYCMALGLFVFAVRFYLYSITTNPVWILPIELSNGITFGLCFAVLISHARIIAPPDSATTLVGFVGALFEGIGVSLGSFIGGLFYESFGGPKAFKLFSYGSLFMCIILVIFIKFCKFNQKELKS